jgi:hypothetical protein
VVPAIKLDKDVDHMQDQIRVELDLVEDIDEKGDLHQPSGPTPNILLDGQPDTEKTEKDRYRFYNAHHSISFKLIAIPKCETASAAPAKLAITLFISK